MGEPRQQLTALVVDDEPAIREYTGIVLREAGLLTIDAGGAAEALTLSKNHSGRIDVLVTDVGLGDGNGIDLAGSIRRERTEMEVLVMSGRPEYLEQATAHKYTFVKKPFKAGSLVDAVRRLLRLLPLAGPSESQTNE